MAGTGALRLGPAARRLISPDRWTDGYPGPVAYGRELDVLLDWASKELPQAVRAQYRGEERQARRGT